MQDITHAPPISATRPRSFKPALRGFQYALLLLIAVCVTFPFYWMIQSSLKTTEELQALPPTWVPRDVDTSGYTSVFKIVPFARAILNSFIIAGGTTLAILVTSLTAGFAFAKYRFKGRDLLFYALVSTMFLPPIVMLVPLYRMMQTAGLTDSYLGVMLPSLANAFGIFLMRQFIAGIPDELLEAARADGANEWTVLWRIVAPLCLPALASLLVFAFVFHWSSFLWPLVMLQSEEKYTVVLAMNRLMSYTSALRYQGVVMAGALISILPSVALFMSLQRYFVAGVAQTGIKG